MIIIKTKTIKIISVISIFAISFLIHNLYEWIPCFCTSIVSPVNESIFEHLKMIFTSYIIWIFIELIINHYKKDKINNIITSNVFTSIINIIIFLIIYLPLYYLIGENMFLNIGVYFISLVISYFINYYAAIKNNDTSLNIASAIIIIIIYIFFGIFTYNPIHADIFLDHSINQYGIPK